ncbi:MAG: dipeptidase, partial [Paludibacteraceae bacterium]|nr:dipeptidase [Paludibacteraceae bacterium]
MDLKKFALYITLSAITIANTFAATNILVGKSSSVDGSTFCTYSADSYYLYGELSHYPASEYSKYTMLDIYGWDTRKYQGKIKQVPFTYAVLGNMNEHQV